MPNRCKERVPGRWSDMRKQCLPNPSKTASWNCETFGSLLAGAWLEVIDTTSGIGMQELTMGNCIMSSNTLYSILFSTDSQCNSLRRGLMWAAHIYHPPIFQRSRSDLNGLIGSLSNNLNNGCHVHISFFYQITLVGLVDLDAIMPWVGMSVSVTK